MSTQEHVDIAKKNALASAVITEQTFDDAPAEVFCPVEAVYIWGWFHDLDATRLNGMSMGPITHAEITAWAQGMNIELLPFERQALREIDKAFMIHTNSKASKKSNG